ncbi:MAG: biotin--[acetyl-CoA-carboxylase] ligase [Legionellaceae bacterium]|nr:biotin--[acetyl-CoA-carboxylase] ligase [Legionellaceae bacterium]
MKNNTPFKHLTCCIAETQTNGRGRFRRHWHSPFGENIYCSLGLCIEGDLSHLSGLSLVVSLAMHHVLQKKTSEIIAIKWPNDLLWRHKKLAGTLIEMVAEGNNSADVIIGMGLNINSCFNHTDNTAKPWCSLHEITGQFFDRNELIAELILTINTYLQQFKHDGFSSFRTAWNEKDYLKNKQFSISGPTGVITGIGHGVNQSGYLLLEDEVGSMHTLSSGDTTLSQE